MCEVFKSSFPYKCSWRILRKHWSKNVWTLRHAVILKYLLIHYFIRKKANQTNEQKATSCTVIKYKNKIKSMKTVFANHSTWSTAITSPDFPSLLQRRITWVVPPSLMPLTTLPSQSTLYDLYSFKSVSNQLRGVDWDSLGCGTSSEYIDTTEWNGCLGIAINCNIF